MTTATLMRYACRFTADSLRGSRGCPGTARGHDYRVLKLNVLSFINAAAVAGAVTP
jgi:hypothetical protein